MIACALFAGTGYAQDEAAKPTLQVTVDENEVYLEIADEVFDLKTGETAIVDADGFKFADRPSPALAWPCGTSYAMGRGTLPTYSINDLPAQGRVNEIVRRYFEDSQVPEGSPRFLNGETHGNFPVADIEALVTDNYFYRAGPPDADKAAQRPGTLLISVFRGTGQVVVDTNFLEELKEDHPDGNIPTLFLFPEENQVPISYFGADPALSDVIAAFAERGIVPADVPMWFAGDRHLELTANDLAFAVGAPSANEIDPARLQQLKDQIQAGGLTLKPVTVTLTPGSNTPAVDSPERVRAAAELGMGTVPTMMSFYTDATHAGHCGLPPPVAAVGALGTSNPAASNPTTPGEVRGPDKPPEIELPNPPQVEPPASGN